MTTADLETAPDASTEPVTEGAEHPSGDAKPAGLADLRRMLDRLTWVHVVLAVAVGIGFWALGTDQGAGRILHHLAVPVVLWGAAALVFVSARWTDDQAESAWRILAVAMALPAAAETVRSVAELAFGAEMEPPTLVQASVVAFSVLVVVGVLRLPHVRTSNASGTRVLLDALAGTVAVSVLAWEWGLGPQLAGGVAEGRFLGAVVLPMLDLVVLGALLAAVLRRSPFRNDLRLWVLAAGLAGLFLADLGLATVVQTDRRAALTAVAWMLPVVAYSGAGWYLRRSLARREVAVTRPPLWKLLLPYSAVAVVLGLFALRLLESEADLGALPIGVLGVGGLLIARQAVAIRENRELVEQERDQLIASFSHELRTPLTAVAGFADILAGGWQELPSREREELLEILRTESGELASMVTDMVSLVRGQLDQVELDLRRVDGKRVIADALRRVFDPQQGPPPVKAMVEPYLEVICDPDRLAQMLAALIANAHMYGGGRIYVIARRTDDGRLFEVHDDGQGVPVRYESLVWERFERGAHRLNARVPGSGLGLAVVRALAAAHGGETGYRRSELLGGACFFVELPYDPDLSVPRD